MVIVNDSRQKNKYLFDFVSYLLYNDLQKGCVDNEYNQCYLSY